MTCDDIKILLMDFLYGEIAPESERLVRAHLQSCSACRTEYEALSRTSLTLKAWENEDPRLHIVFVQENKSWLGALQEKLFPSGVPAWGKLAWLSAGIAIGVLFISALLNTEISFTRGNFTYRTSLLPRSSATVDSQVVAQIRQQLDEKYQQLLLASQQQQRDEFNRTLAKFASEIDRQRQSDLMLVGRGLDEFQQHTNSRFERNDELLNQFLRTVKLPLQR
jgi:hypothetical protein